MISLAACQPLSGRLTDIYSRRWGLIFSNVFFALGNLLCGVAPSDWVMILGRVIAGIGGGGLLSISTFTTSDLVPLLNRGLWQGLGNICFGAGASLGGLFGGLINDRLGWRWAFLVQLPVMLISCALAFNVKIPEKKKETARIDRVDFLGALTLILCLVTLLLGLNTGGNQVPWTHPLVLVTLPASAVFLGLFIYIEARVATEPVIPVKLLLNRTVASACLSNWLTMMVAYGFLFYLPIYLQVQGLSTTAAGLRLIPQSIGMSIGSFGSGLAIRWSGRYKMLSYGAMALLVTSMVLASTLTFSSPAWLPFLSIFPSGVGWGSSLTITLVAMTSAVDHEYHAVVTSAAYAFRSTGGSIGVTIASAVFQQTLSAELWSRFGGRERAPSVIGRLRDNLDEIHNLPGDWTPGVLGAYMKSLHAMFLALLGLAILNVIVSIAMRENKLHGR